MSWLTVLVGSSLPPTPLGAFLPVFLPCSFENLRLIRDAGVTCPLLCKEFIVEAYQVFKARAR
jgi:hypothetical protein